MPPPFPHHPMSNPTSASTLSSSTPGTSPPYGTPFLPMPTAGSGYPAMSPVYYPQYTAPPNFMSTPRDPLESENDFGCVPLPAPVPATNNLQDFRRPGPELPSNSSGPRSNQMYAQGQGISQGPPNGGFNQPMDPRILQHQAYQREPKNLTLSRVKAEANQAEIHMAQMKNNWNVDQQKANLEQHMMRQQRENAQKYGTAYTMLLNQQAAQVHGPNQGGRNQV